MKKNISMLLVGPVFNEGFLHKYHAISAASNFWMCNFAISLQNLGNSITCLGYIQERVWPFGKLTLINSDQAFHDNLNGSLVSYLNVPFLRKYLIKISALFKNNSLYQSGLKCDVVISFSCLNKSTDWSAMNDIARSSSRKFNVPWICIVADGEAPVGADGYIYLAWSSFKKHSSNVPKLYIEGGILEREYDFDNHCTRESDITKFIYAGDLGPHGGVSDLCQAVLGLDNFHYRNFQLHLYGRGHCPELTDYMEADNRIFYKGFVEEDVLEEACRNADVFINPRTVDYAPNSLNFPSKILYYLSFKKPVISAKTLGVPPEYDNVLLTYDGTISGLRERLCFAFNQKEREKFAPRMNDFLKKKTWEAQSKKVHEWLEEII